MTGEPSSASPSLALALGRGAIRHCPRCGSGRLFRHWTAMIDSCPRCGLYFERTEGYWTGSMGLNLFVTEGLFLTVFVAMMLVTWPDVPWSAVLVVGVSISFLTPIVFHPVSRTLWVAAERHYSGGRDEPGD
jgi:uncharacterized protein (DUF983 family)